MNKIFKYSLPAVSGEYHIALPLDAEIISAQSQYDNQVSIWALFKQSNQEKIRKFILLKTGEFIPFGYTNLKFISTLQFNAGFFILHLFEAL